MSKHGRYSSKLDLTKLTPVEKNLKKIGSSADVLRSEYEKPDEGIDKKVQKINKQLGRKPNLKKDFLIKRESDQAKKSDAELREAINTIANQVEAEPELMGLVSPEEHSKIKKRQLKRRQTRKEKESTAEEIISNAGRRATKDFFDMMKLIKRNSKLNPEQKREEEIKIKKLLQERAKEEIQPALDIKESINKLGPMNEA